ncbi:MAG: pyridoxamine 5'-phosphate oxidase family protein [Tissierellaceae bacterium]|nr:pyridoxamine 5'-phosphate oxidase family protein [Tissierellaceae bacterium]
MRREDREMDKEFAVGVIDKSRYGVLSMVDGDMPHGLPLSIVRDGDNLYFHSAMEGQKVDVLAKYPNVSIVFVGEVKVPENYTKEELDEIIKDEEKIPLLTSSVFTTEFESAIVKGKVTLVESKEEQVKAMKLICEKYTPTKMAYFDLAVESGLKRANVYKVKIKEITGKRKKYDIHGKEMKWGRME